MQRRRLALLALLALSGRRGMSRERVQAHLWPDSTTDRARHALDQLLYATRRDLGRDVIQSGTSDLRLNPAVVQPDTWAFEDAIADGRWVDVVAIYGGPVLQGFHLIDDGEFEQWLDGERTRYQQEYHRALEELARAAAAQRKYDDAVRWWRERVASDPLNAAVTLELMHALMATMDRTGALTHAHTYQELVRTSLEIEPDESVAALANSIAKPAPQDAIDNGLPVLFRETFEPTSPIATRNDATSTRRSVPRSRLIMAAAAVVTLGIAMIAWREQSNVSSENSVADSVMPDAGTRSLYLRARMAWNTRTEEGLTQAIVLFRRATEREPTYANAYTGLAESYAMLGYFGFAPGDAMFPKARAAAVRALELDSTQGGAYAALGQVLAWEHAWTDAEKAYHQALRFSPDNATAHQWYGLLLAYLGRTHEAAVHTGHASRLDPLSVQISNMYGMMLYHDGELEAALRQYERTVNAEPDSAWVRQNPWVMSNYGSVAGAAGRYVQAIQLIERALQVVPTHPRPLLDLALVYTRIGDVERARAVFTRADTTHAHYPVYRGQLYTQLGQLDSAFVWFGRVGDWPLPSLVGLNNGQAYAELRADPRYQSILQRVGMSAR